MGLPRDVHVKAHLLDGVGDIGPREGQVLKSADEAPVGRHIEDWGPIILRELRLSVDRHARHASSLDEDVEGVLTLVEEETLRLPLGCDALMPRKWCRGPRSFIANSR
jgi:hypothetical protein